MTPFYGCGSTVSRLQSHYEGTVNFLPCYFDTINLKQPGFRTIYSFKIFVSKRKCKNNLRNCESQTKKSLQFSYAQCLCNVLLQNPVVLPRF